MATIANNIEIIREQYWRMKSDPVISAYNNKLNELRFWAPIRRIDSIDQPITLREDFQQAIVNIEAERDAYISANYPI